MFVHSALYHDKNLFGSQHNEVVCHLWMLLFLHSLVYHLQTKALVFSGETDSLLLAYKKPFKPSASDSLCSNLALGSSPKFVCPPLQPLSKINLREFSRFYFHSLFAQLKEKFAWLTYSRDTVLLDSVFFLLKKSPHLTLDFLPGLDGLRGPYALSETFRRWIKSWLSRISRADMRFLTSIVSLIKCTIHSLLSGYLH